MSDSEHLNSATDQQDDASLSDVLPAAQQFIYAWQARVENGLGLLQADIRLSLKALAICAMTTLFLVAATISLWLGINIAIAIGLHQLGVYWLFTFLTILTFNAGAFWWLLRLFKGAYRAIFLRTSFNHLFGQQSSEPADAESVSDNTDTADSSAMDKAA
ncbi:hypothetical protein [Neptunicella marina]|uniref:Uncharacterized protein n=1 Tax=Neptunicella marina TaxID=2125989 RepID=A0A8J6M0X2_9ALTE|nr:hypothetical protein [Neptunicella marina]MBC3767439.1 hypothetical protein [Neptunicella marina]